MFGKHSPALHKFLLHRMPKLLVAVSILLSAVIIPQYAVFSFSGDLEITIITNSSVKLTWQNNLPRGYNYWYRVERSKDGGGFAGVATLYADAYSSGGLIDWYDYSLDPGHVYTYRVLMVDSSNVTSTYTGEVTAVMVSPTAPNSLTVTPVSPYRIDLKWTYPDSKNISTAVERKVGADGTWSLIAILPSGVNEYSDTGLAVDTQYFYRVKAVYGTNVYSVPYPNNNIGIAAYTVLEAPSDLYAYITAPGQVCLSWKDNSNETNFIIERKKVGFQNFEHVGTTLQNETTWIDSGLEINGRYVYRVKAITGTNSSNYSEELTVACIYLEPPTDLRAVAEGDSEIRLSWVDRSSDETGFEVWRKEGPSGAWEKYATTGRNVTSFVDRNVLPDTQYFYKVKGRLSYYNVNSAFSNEARAWTVPINVPTGLDYTVTDNNGVKLAWKDNSSSESGFQVERKAGIDGEWTIVAVLPANTTSFEFKNLDPDTRYFFRIRVLDNNFYNSVALSDEIEVSTRLPEAPGNLMARRVSSTQIKLTWTDLSDNESGFIIERKMTATGRYREVGRVSADTVEYTDNGLRPGIGYYYRICAYNKAGKSTYSRGVYATTAEAVTFKDVPASHWAKKEIDILASRGAFPVKSGGMLYPDEKLTRGEFVYMLIKVLAPDMIPVGSFRDVTPAHKFYREIIIAKKMGIVSGDLNGNFNPDRELKREDMAVMVVRALKALEKPLPAHDVSILGEYRDKGMVSSYALDSLASLIGEKIINGVVKEGRYFLEPQKAATRAEAAVVIVKAVNR